MTCRVPTPAEIIAITSSNHYSSAAHRVGLVDNTSPDTVSIANRTSVVPTGDFPASGLDLVIDRHPLTVAHYSCGFQALGLDALPQDTTDSNLAALQSRARNFTPLNPALDRPRLNSAAVELGIIDWFQLSSTDGGGDTDNDINHISAEEWGSFIDTLVAREPSIQVSETGTDGMTTTREETTEEKRTRISQREWRNLATFLRLVRYYNNDATIQSLPTWFIDRDSSANDGNQFWTDISGALVNREQTVTVFNFSGRQNGGVHTFTGLSEYLVPHNAWYDQNRRACASTDVSWNEGTRACTVLIDAANYFAAYHYDRAEQAVAQRTALVNRDRRRTYYEVAGGVVVAAVAAFGAWRWSAARTERRLRAQFAEEGRAQVREGFAAEINGIRETAAASRRGFEARSSGTNPMTNTEVSAVLQGLEERADRVAAAVRAGPLPQTVFPPPADTRPMGRTAQPTPQDVTRPGTPNPALLRVTTGQPLAPRPTGWNQLNPRAWYRYGRDYWNFRDINVGDL